MASAFLGYARLGLVVLAAVSSGCSLGRVDERVKYWTDETREHLPVGTPLSNVQHFFEVRGLALACCVSGPPGAQKYYFATERKVGRVLLTEYDVAILVALGPSQRIESVRVERWGVGL